MTLPSQLRDLLSTWTDGDNLAQQGYVQVEGAEAVRWLLASQLTIHAIIGKPSTLQSLSPEIDAFRAAQPQSIHALSKPELAEALAFRFDRGVVALAIQPNPVAQQTWLQTLDHQEGWGLIFADSIHDPRNVGAIIRSGRCFGCDGIILGPGSANHMSRRAIRAGVGHPLQWPALTCDDAIDCLQRLRQQGAAIIAGHRGPQSRPLSTIQDIARRWVLVMGNEDRGVHPELLPHCTHHCHIPMSNDCDSLNVGAATAVLLHHFVAISPGNSPSCLTAYAPSSHHRIS